MSNWFLDKMNMTEEEKEWLFNNVPELREKVDAEIEKGMKASEAMLKIAKEMLEKHKQEASVETA